MSTRNQHVVPQMHLRKWTDQNVQVFAYEIKNQKLFKTTPRNICSHRDYYEIEKAVKLPSTIENFLSEEIEAPAANPLNKLANLDPNSLTAEEYESLSYYFGFQVTRTPYAHTQFNKIALKIAQDSAVSFLNDEAKFKEFEKDWKDEHPGKKFYSREDLKKQIESGEIHLKVNGNDHNLYATMLIGQAMQESYEHQTWTLLHAVKRRQFICNDNPVVTITGISYQGEKTETIVPISPKVCLLMEKSSHPKPISIVVASGNIVREVNQRIALHSERFLVGSNEKLVARIANESTLKQLEEKDPGSIIDNVPFKSIGQLIPR